MDYSILIRYPNEQLKYILKEHALKKKKHVKGIYKMNKKQLIYSLQQLKYAPKILPDITKVERLSQNALKKYANVKKYTDIEQISFIEDNYKVINPLHSKKEYLNPKTNQFESTKLQKHQSEFVSKFIMGNFQGAIAFHGVGSGKTLTAVVYSHYYLTMYPKNKVVVISPPALLTNFLKGMEQYGLNLQDNRYEFITYVKFSNAYGYYTNKDTLLIIDEAHNFRTHIISEPAYNLDKTPMIDKYGMPIYNTSSNKRGKAILEACKQCHKSLLLTGTPFINKLYDIENLISMVDKKDPLSENNFAHIVINENYINDYFQYRISYYPTESKSEYFPEVTRKYVPILLSGVLLENYNKIEQGNIDSLNIDEDSLENSIFGNKKPTELKAFHNATRRYCEFIGALKINYIMDKILKSKGKAIIYTTFINTSLNLYISELEKHNIKYGVISGGQSFGKKLNMQNDYNSGIIRVLLITKAGTEGIDTVATENIFICEPLWNESLTEQAIARAVRYKSHYHLPKDQRHVNVYRIILCKNENDEKMINNINKDIRLGYDAIIEKLKIINKEARELSTFNEYRNINLTTAQLKDLSPAKRNLYYASKKTSRYETDNTLRELFAQIPCIEVYLTIMSLSKQSSIIEFVKIFSRNTPKIEDYKSNIEKKITPLIEKGKINEILKVQKEELEKEKMNVRKELINKTSDVNILLNKVSELHEKQKKKLITVKLFQEFFTPEPIINEMLKTSTKIRKENGLHILEPTAGSGNIVKKLVNYKSVSKIDMVEIAKPNRDILEELVNIAPDVFKLFEEGDFLKFMTPTRYDIIIMNPPFHLRKSYLQYLDRDYYDMDFVMKAYNFLKIGGELIALVRMENKNKVKFIKWINSKNSVVIDLKNIKWKQSKEKGSDSKINNINLSIIHIIKNEEETENIIIERTNKEDDIINLF